MQFRKKPVVIEATQWFKHGDHPAVVQQHGIDPPTIGWVPTLEGGHQVTPGDWIITGVANENYPCKPDIFAMTYEPASAVPAAAPAAPPTSPRPSDEQIDSLLQDLDQIARDHDVFEYGLPLHSNGEDEGPPMSKLREAVQDWLRSAAPDALSRSHELLRQARDALESSESEMRDLYYEHPSRVQNCAAIAAITAYLPKEPT